MHHQAVVVCRTPDRWLSMHLHVRGLAGATYGEIWGDLGGPGRVSNVSFGEVERDHFPKNFEVLNGKILVNLGVDGFQWIQVYLVSICDFSFIICVWRFPSYVLLFLFQRST